VFCDWSFRQNAHLKGHIARKHPGEECSQLKPTFESNDALAVDSNPPSFGVDFSVLKEGNVMILPERPEVVGTIQDLMKKFSKADSVTAPKVH
jgi:hypothetical protein